MLKIGFSEEELQEERDRLKNLQHRDVNPENLQQNRGPEDQNLQQRGPEDQNLQQKGPEVQNFEQSDLINLQQKKGSEDQNLQQKQGSSDQNLQQKCDPEDQNLHKRGSRRGVAKRPPPVHDPGKIRLIETRKVEARKLNLKHDYDKKMNSRKRKRKSSFDCGRRRESEDLCWADSLVQNFSIILNEGTGRPRIGPELEK